MPTTPDSTPPGTQMTMGRNVRILFIFVICCLVGILFFLSNTGQFMRHSYMENPSKHKESLSFATGTPSQRKYLSTPSQRKYLSTPQVAQVYRTTVSVSQINTTSQVNAFYSTTQMPNNSQINTSNPIQFSPALNMSDEYYWSAVNQLQSGLVPPVIHFVWCAQRWFDYKHYLSILSVIRSVRPDKIILHYEHLPDYDPFYYNQWLDILAHEYPFLHLDKLNEDDSAVCNEIPYNRMKIILSYLSEEGGMFIGENTWLLRYSPEERKMDLDFALEADGREGYLLLRGGILQNRTYQDILQNETYKTRSSSCTTLRQWYAGSESANCLIVQGGRYGYFNPIHIWELDDSFGRVARTIFYGSGEIVAPKPSYDELVPNIGHMIWLGGRGMDFVFYLGALSLLHVAEVERLYIHGDKTPKGIYWRKLKKHKRVTFVFRTEPVQIYQSKVESPKMFRALMSDFIRVDLMIKYGGIYTDADAIWVKPLSYEDRGYDAVASFDWIDWTWPWPDSVNFGVSYGKKNAPFWRIFRNTMRTLRNHVHGYSGVMMPYKILERYRHLLKIDPHLQTICYQLRCHPTYVEDYHNETLDHVTDNSIPNWRKDLHAFHWTHPNPPEYENEEALRNGTGMFAEIGQNVLKKAGLWD